MRIGVDAACWRNNRGFGRFTRELLSALFTQSSDHEFVAFTDDSLNDDLRNFDIELVTVGADRKVIDAAIATDRRSINDIFSFTTAAAREKLDLMFFPAVYSWFPPPRRIPSVVTFHDAIAEHYPELVFPRMRERFLWNAKTWLAKKSCKKVLTVSQAAKQEITQYLKIPEHMIDVICEGADRVFVKNDDPARAREVRTNHGIPQQSRLLVYVGGFAPHKNLVRLLDALALAISRPGVGDLFLAMVGDPGGGGFHSVYDDLQAKIASTPALSDRVRFTGYVSDEDLAILYSDALALVLPSLSEGFGLPAVEAMSCGTPVLAAEDGAVMEVAGASGLAFDPYDVPAIANAITSIATDISLYNALRARTADETARNSWPRAAELTLCAFETCQGGA